MKIESVLALVRPFVTVAMASALIAGFFLGKVDQNAFLPIASGAIMFWYAARSAQKTEND